MAEPCSRLVFRVPAFRAMVAHCQQEWPREACGLLSGSGQIVAVLHPLHNIAATPESRYLADPAELLGVHRAIRAAGQEILGIYHSHPRSTPDPSRTDLKDNFWGGVPRVIISLRERARPDVRVWWLGPNCFQGLPWRLAGSLEPEP